MKMLLSEVFLSIEGEAVLVGMPTIFIRFFGCNFTCSGFNANSLNSAQPTGCDTPYSWHRDFNDLATEYTVETLIDKIELLTKECRNFPLKLSFTGGEPTLFQKQILFILSDAYFSKFGIILIETNASVPLQPWFVSGLNELIDSRNINDTEMLVMFSNSPKLSNSGESRERAIKPEVFRQQAEIKTQLNYLKFVSDGSDASFKEIEEVLGVIYPDYIHGISSPVYVMPEGATVEQQTQIQEKVAQKCIEFGYIFCIRAHTHVFGDKKGT
jgi:organic radical activating enzyme